MRSSVKALATGLVFAASTISSVAFAQPSGGTVVFGGATIGTPNATTTLITQTTNSAIINWQSFSLPSGSSVVFSQPNAAAIALNRVLGGGVSQIDGNLSANGQVWIINANGILFGKGSQVAVAGLLATTSDIADGDFESGQYKFGIASTNPAATVENAGSINVGSGGSAVLSGPHVANSGLIEADGGQIVLGGASAFTVDFAGDNLLRYAITTPVGATPTDANGNAQPELVGNSGTLSAAGGRILLTARAAASVADNVVNNTGMISATSATVANGEVILDAGSGSVQDSGTINATGNGSGQTGGTVALAGNSINVADNAVIDASGDAGGGTVSIGGGLHGSGALPPASTTNVGAATIRADANTTGNGGTISIWSTNSSTVNANLSAKGGAQSGDGGTVETSGATLQVGDATSVDTSAPIGRTGTWLLDPLFLIVADGGTQSLGTGNIGANNDPGQTDTVAPATIIAALSHTNVTLQALDDLTVNSAISGSANGNTLNLAAGRSIFLNADINLTGNQDSLILTSDNSSFGRTDPGPGVISGTGVLTAGKILLASDSDGSDGGTIGTTAQPISIGGGKVTVDTKGADVFIQSLVAGANLLLGKVSVGAGDFTALSAGNLTIASGATITSSAGGDAVVLSASQNFVNNSGSGAISLTGGGRFLIYSAAPAGDVFGGLNSHNTAVWNSTYPAAVSQAGNRYVFAMQPTLTFTSTNVAKTYGTDNSAAVATAYVISGFNPGVANAFLADNAASTFTGTPSVTSVGSAAGASVAGGPYQITVAAGSLTTTSGYALQFTSTGRLTVNPANLLITANDQSMTYGGAMPTLTVKYSGFVNGDTAASLTTAPTVVSGTAASANAGTYVGTLTANGAVDSNYTISYAPGTLTINKAALLITANDQSMTYGGAMPTLTVKYSGFVNGDTAASLTTAPTVVSGTAANANAGTYVGTLTANGAVDNNYTISYAPGTLTITQALLSVVADGQSKVYGTADPALTYSFAGLVNGDTSAVFSGVLTRAAGENAGNYAITQGTLSAGPNYAISFTGANFAITPATLTYVANSANRTYGSPNPAFTGTVTGFVNGDTLASATTGTLDFTTTATQASNVGSYAINGSGLSANNGNYVFAQAAGNASALTINPATLTYVATSSSRSYGANNPVFNGTVTGFVNGDTLATATTGTLTFTSPATSSSNVGSYAINGSGLAADNGNYVFAQAAGNASALTITAATLTYVADPFSRAYGSANPAFTGTVTGFVNGDTQASATSGTLTFASLATASSGVGSYAINGSGLSANNGNYVFAQAASNATALTITQALLSVVADGQSKVYGAPDPALTYTFAGLVNGDTSAVFSGALTRAAGQNVGNYAIMQGTLSAGPNYAISFTGANFAITPALLSVTANAQTVVYGMNDPNLTYTFSGLVNGDTSAVFSGALTRAPGQNVGNYAITQGTLSAGGNYTISFAGANFAITPATLTYVAKSGTIDQGTAIPALSGSVTGFVNGDTLASATTGTLLFTTSATSSSPSGVYAIDGSGLSANNGNYVFVQAAGNATALTINNVVVQNVGLGGYYPPTAGGDRPGSNGPGGGVGQNDNGGSPPVIVAGGGSGGGANNVPSVDTTGLPGPIAELAASQGYIEPPTNADLRTSSLSSYFDNGSLFDNNFPSWANDAFFWP